uniref:Uncharacterized protein n=1 Tax=Glossina austeni TaxID=7395 RepID=A0A1A9VXG2_GLOAU
MSDKNLKWCENLSGAIHVRKLICAGPIWWLDTEKTIAEAFHATSEIQDIVRELAINGRLEFVGGGWVINDEACSHYQIRQPFVYYAAAYDPELNNSGSNVNSPPSSGAYVFKTQRWLAKKRQPQRKTAVDGNRPLKKMKRLKFQRPEFGVEKLEYYEVKYEPLQENLRALNILFQITMEPMQIRAFIIKYEKFAKVQWNYSSRIAL